MSGDIPVETKKVEAEAKPLLLTSSVSMDVYLPQEAQTADKTNGGINGFVQECYSQPKCEAVKPEAKTTDQRTESAKEADKKFRELLEKASLSELNKIAKTQKRVIEGLHRVIDGTNCCNPGERKEMARITSRAVEGLTAKMAAIDEVIKARNANAPAEIQKGIDSGKIDLSDVSAKLNFKTTDGEFNVSTSGKKLTFKSDAGRVSYKVEDGYIVEEKNGVEKQIGPAGERASYEFRDGALRKIDPSDNCSEGPRGPVFGMGGDDCKLNPEVETNGAGVTMKEAGAGFKLENTHSESNQRLAKLEEKLKAAEAGECPPTCNDHGNGGGHGNGSGAGNGASSGNGGGDGGRGGLTSRPNGWGGESGSSSGSTGEYTSGSHSGSAVHSGQRIESVSPVGTTVSSTPPAVVRQSEVGVLPSGRPVISQETRIEVTNSQPRVDQRSVIQPVGAAPVAVNRPIEQQLFQSIMAPVADASAALPRNYYDTRMDQVAQRASQQVAPELSKLQALLTPASQSQVSQPGFNKAFYNPGSVLNNNLQKPLSPLNQQQPHQFLNNLAKSALSGDPQPKTSLPPSYQAFRYSTPENLNRTASGSLNQFGKPLQEMKDVNGKAGQISQIGLRNVGGTSMSGHMPGRKLGELIADKTPSAHTNMTDKWNPIRSGGGGSAASVEGPFIPIAGRVGGAGASTGGRGDGVKSPTTKPDGRVVEGVRVQGGSNAVDGGKKIDGLKSVEGVKSNGGSNVVDGGKKIDGVKSVEGIKSNGGSNLIDGGKRIVGVNSISGIQSSGGADAVRDNNVGPGAVVVGQSVGNGAIKDSKVRGERQEQVTQGQPEGKSQKDPGFGYTPRRSAYTVKAGETLESIARQRWGDERLAELIRTINLHRLAVIQEGSKAVLKLSAGDILWLPSPVEAERFKKVCDIKGDGQRSLTVGFSV